MPLWLLPVQAEDIFGANVVAVDSCVGPTETALSEIALLFPVFYQFALLIMGRIVQYFRGKTKI